MAEEKKNRSADIPKLSPDAQELQLEIANLSRLIRDSKNLREVTGVVTYESPLTGHSSRKQHLDKWAQTLLQSRLSVVSKASVISDATSSHHGYNSTMNIAAEFVIHPDPTKLEEQVGRCALQLRCRSYMS